MTWLNSLTPMAHSLPLAAANATCGPSRLTPSQMMTLIHDHRGDAAGDKLPELRPGRLALVRAFEHERAICPIGKEDADAVVQNIADARGKVCTERRLEARKDDQVQQRCDPAEKQVGQTLIVFFG